MNNDTTNESASASRSAYHRDSANLDFLRSIAVLLVYVTHLYGIYTGSGTKWDLFWHIGQLGVLMFFVHTCLVLMWSLERSGLQDIKLFVSFYTRRIFRLYPLSIVCVLVAYIVDLHWEPVNLWQNLTLTQNLFYTNQPVFPPILTPLWSLPLEVQMYVVLPVLFLILRERPMKLLAAIWVGSVALAFIQPQLGERFGILKFAPCFLGGVFAWRIMRRRYAAWLPGWLWPLAMAAVSMVWMTSTDRYLPFHIAAFGLCLGLAIPLFHEIPWSSVKSASHIIARYSYGIYLSHFAIQLYCFRDSRYPFFKVLHQLPRISHYARPLHFALCFGLSVLIPLGLYHLIENPGIRLGQKLARWMTGSREQGGDGRSDIAEVESELHAEPER
jgi:peptidoglycan/LPS O-acetylase OafA/YrhL